MNVVEISEHILDELHSVISQVDADQTEELVQAILHANRIFTAGAGRSLLMIRGMAMRLMHMGFETYVVGETVTPAIAPGDLLIIASGSGETGTVCVMARKAKAVGAQLAAITIYPESTIGKLADHIVEVKAACMKEGSEGGTSFQPGDNTFEQSVLILGDAIVMRIIELKGLQGANTQLWSRHANLE